MKKRLIKERDRLYSMHPMFADRGQMHPFYNRNLVQNRVDYTCNYDNIGASDSDYVVKDITSFKESGNIRYKIERMSLDDGFSISGWAYIEGSSFNNIKKVKGAFRI